MILYRDSLLAGTCKAELEAFLVALVGLQKKIIRWGSAIGPEIVGPSALGSVWSHSAVGSPGGN
jgi:hypothetical protein